MEGVVIPTTPRHSRERGNPSITTPQILDPRYRGDDDEDNESGTTQTLITKNSCDSMHHGQPLYNTPLHQGSWPLAHAPTNDIFTMKKNVTLRDRFSGLKNLFQTSTQSSTAKPTIKKTAPFFDCEFYQEQCDHTFPSDQAAIEHFLGTGWRNNLSPSRSFSVPHYLSAYPDIREAGVNPLLHFLESGWRENRQAFSQSGHVNELVGYQRGKLIPLGPRPLGLYLEWTSCTRLAGWVANSLGDNKRVQIFHQSEIIGYARLQRSHATPEDITYSHFEFYVEKPVEQISARYTDEGRTDGGKAAQPKSVEASLNSPPNQGVGYSSVDDFLNRPIADTPSVAPCSKELIKAFIAKKRELVRQANPTGISDIKVSVVMPVFNRQSLAPMAIKSVAQQRMPNWELIIVDDGSTDQSLQTVRETVKELGIEHKTQILGLETNTGVSHARNHGLAVARGPIIAYLDSDNSWDRDYLYLITAAFDANPDTDSVYAGQYVYFFNEVLKRRYLAGIRLQAFNRELLEQENYIDLNIFAHRKKLHDQMGGFNEQMRRLVDWDLILKYTREHEPLMIPALLAQYNMGIAENQITSSETYQLNFNVLRDNLFKK